MFHNIVDNIVPTDFNAVVYVFLAKFVCFACFLI